MLLSACDENTMRTMEKQKSLGLTAEDIDPDLGGKCTPDATGNQYSCSKNTLEENKTTYTKKTYIAYIIGDSQKKCDDFIRHLSLAESNNTNNISVAGTATSALNASLPTGAMANASSLVGIANNNDSETYARKNITNYIQAIRINYGGKIKKYSETLEEKDEAKLNAVIEINTIRMIHTQCSLNAAQSYISDRLNESSKAEEVKKP